MSLRFRVTHSSNGNLRTGDIYAVPLKAKMASGELCPSDHISKRQRTAMSDPASTTSTSHLPKPIKTPTMLLFRNKYGTLPNVTADLHARTNTTTEFIDSHSNESLCSYYSDYLTAQYAAHSKSQLGGKKVAMKKGGATDSSPEKLLHQRKPHILQHPTREPPGCGEIVAVVNNSNVSTVNAKLTCAVPSEYGILRFHARDYFELVMNLLAYSTRTHFWIYPPIDTLENNGVSKKKMSTSIVDTEAFHRELYAIVAGSEAESLNRLQFMKSVRMCDAHRRSFPVGSDSSSTEKKTDPATFGYVLEDLLLGESPEERRENIQQVLRCLEVEQPRIAFGIKSINDIFSAVECGVDVVDGTYPTALTDQGYALTPGSKAVKINLWDSIFKSDVKTLGPDCACLCCKSGTGYSRAYLHHLLITHEMLGSTLLMLHNTHVLASLFKDIQAAVARGQDLSALKSRFLSTQ